MTENKCHPVDQLLPPWQLAAFGMQHVLTFYAAAVAVPVILAASLNLPRETLEHLISADLFTCGIATLLQSVGVGRIGARLPLLQGVTFTALPPMIVIGSNSINGIEGLKDVYGAVIVAGLLTFLLAPFFARLSRFFPPVVNGTVILVIGMALLPVAAADLAPQTHAGSHPTRGLCYGLGTFALILGIQRFSHGIVANMAVLIGMSVGALFAWVFGDVHLEGLPRAGYFSISYPFAFGFPNFHLVPILSMSLVMLVTMMETAGNLSAVGEIVQREIVPADIAAAVRADGLATCIGGVLNSFPYTCFAENVGLVRLTQVRSRWVVASAACIMILLGCIPKISAVMAAVPLPVLGGASLAMFAAVAVVGMQILAKSGVDDHRNSIVIGASLALAALAGAEHDNIKYLPPLAQIILGSGISVGAISALLLNTVFNNEVLSQEKERN